MVALDKIQASNASIAASYPEGLVAVFAGATAGIGETSLREFVRHTSKPRIYIIGRSKEACDRLDADLKSVNPSGQYTFIRSDMSLLRNVDEACRDIRSRESAINVLFMSQGTLNLSKETEEGLNYMMGLTYFGRLRMATNLLPLLQRGAGLRRVVSSFTGAHEGPVYADDWQGKQGKVPMLGARGHAATMMTLGLAALARKQQQQQQEGPGAPGVSFVHNFPGSVKTNLIRGDEGFVMQVMKYVGMVTMAFKGWVPLQEVGERHAFYCTSAKYAPRDGGRSEGVGMGVGLPAGVGAARGVDGELGGGVYTVDEQGESAGKKVEEILAKYREDGTMDRLWEYTESEFKRVTGTVSI